MWIVPFLYVAISTIRLVTKKIIYSRFLWMLNTILFQSTEAFFSYKTLGPKKMFIKNIMLYVQRNQWWILKTPFLINWITFISQIYSIDIFSSILDVCCGCGCVYCIFSISNWKTIFCAQSRKVSSWKLIYFLLCISWGGLDMITHRYIIADSAVDSP